MYFCYYIMNTVKFETFKVEKMKYLKQIRYFIVKLGRCRHRCSGTTFTQTKIEYMYDTI